MKSGLVTFLTSISLLALLAGGCANKEAVKSEAAVVPAAVVEKVETKQSVKIPVKGRELMYWDFVT